MTARLLSMLGKAPVALLDDKHPGVRACAALAPTFACEPVATSAILEALLSPGEADRWSGRHLPGQEGWLRFDLIRAATECVSSFELLLPAALPLLAMASASTIASDWGPLLLAAFPAPYRDGVTMLTAAQRDFLAALVDREGLWGGRGTASSLWLEKAGLRYDRDWRRSLL